MSNYKKLFFLFIIIILAIHLRLNDLSHRPFHGDEANQSFLLKSYLEGDYSYNKTDFHGPSLYFFSKLFLQFFKSNIDFLTLDKFDLRIIIIFFSIAVLIYIIIISLKLFSYQQVLFIAILFSISPIMVFYSSYYIHEYILIFFSVLCLVQLRFFLENKKKIHLILIACYLAFMHWTKETFIINIFAIIISLFFINSFKKIINFFKSKNFILLLISFFIISALLYSSFFSKPKQIIDSYTTYYYYLKRGLGHNDLPNNTTDGKGHSKEFSYYLKTMMWNNEQNINLISILYNFRKRPYYEFFIVILYFIGLIFYIKQKTKNKSDITIKFLSIYSFIVFMVYSLIPYKAPWCILNFYWAWIVVAGATAAKIFKTIKNNYLKSIFILLFILFSLDLYQQSKIQKTSSSTQNPYSYVHPVKNIEKIIPFLEKIYNDNKKIYVIMKNYWPLPWYLKKFIKTSYLENKEIAFYNKNDIFIINYFNHELVNKLDNYYKKKIFQRLEGDIIYVYYKL